MTKPTLYQITTSRLRKIEKDWLSLLPGFSAFGKPGAIKRRVGPLLISISIARGGRGANDYYPLFFVQKLSFFV